MKQKGILSFVNWALYAIALFLIYHILVKPAFLDFSWIALLALLLLLAVGYFLPHPAERRQILVFSLGFLLLDRALTQLDVKSIAAVIIGGGIAVLVVALVAKWYGRLKWQAVFALVLVAVVMNTTFYRENLYALSHFTVKYESDRLYNGSWVDYFPITLHDVDGDGTEEIITYGNAEELPLPEEEPAKPETEEERKALAHKLLYLQTEPISIYVMKWQDGKLVRIPNGEISAESMTAIKDKMPKDAPGFPYYTMKNDQLVPNVQRQSYAEGMLQVGTAPYRALLLDLQHIGGKLLENGGSMDVRHKLGSKYENLSIREGMISGSYEGKPFGATTNATKIVGTMNLPDGREGLMVMGEHMSVLAVEPDGTAVEAYTLTRKETSMATADFIPADLDGDGADELLLANKPSYILKPQADGSWEVLWSSDEKDGSFRFTNFAAIGGKTEPEIVAQAKSWVSANETRYLSGFAYTPDGLKQTWRIYMPLLNVRVGDVDGDKQNEIIASVYDQHCILIFKRHNIPVIPLVSLLLAGLIGYGMVRRVRHA